MKKVFFFSAACLLCCSFQNRFPLAVRPAELDPAVGQLLSQYGIVSAKKIIIHNYPKAYNPSLISYDGGYLLSFRVKSEFLRGEEKDTHRRNASLIGVAKLDNHFNVLKKTIQLLDVKSHSSKISYTAEDARLFYIGEKIYILFNDVPLFKAREGFCMYLGELVESDGRFVLKERAKHLRYLHAIGNEKNWSPFVSRGRLYLIYSDQPRIILEVDLSSGECRETIRTFMPKNWDWGVIRGGTPALLAEDVFLTFFHSSIHVGSSKNRHELNYLMGAYAFEQEFPFAIRAISPAPLGRAVEDYLLDNRRKVVFPAGLVIDGDLIHVSWGKDDNQVWITTFDKKKLLDSLSL